MQKNNYSEHQAVLNFLTYVLWGTYFFTLVIASSKLLMWLVMQIAHIFEALTYNLSLSKAINPFEVFLYSIVFVFIICLWVKVAQAIFQVFKVTRATNDFLRNIPTYYSRRLHSYVIQTNRLYAFTAGVFKPKIYISKEIISTLSRKELKAIILHEQHHAQNFDPLKDIVNKFIVSAIPWLSYKHSLSQNYEVITELSADNFAKEHMNTDKFLLSALAKLFDISHVSSLNTSSFFSRLERIPILTGNKIFTLKSNYILLIANITIIIYVGISLNSFNSVARCEDFKQCISSLFVDIHQPGQEIKSSCLIK